MDAVQPGALIAMKNTSGLCISRTATRLTRLGKTMAKSLADMTAEEREECVGMWCEIAGQLEILAEPDGMVDYHDTAILHSVKRNGGGYVLAKDVIPRFDLPRAWTPGGEPVAVEWEQDNELL